jgi:hypothetical protein
MLIKVRCRCAVERTIDTDTVGPWRLRCKQCHDTIYDPEKAAQKRAQVETTDDEKSQFNDWLQGSAELKVLMSSEGEPEKTPNCPTHPKYKIVAACSKCDKLLCKHCLDRVGDQFTCSECVANALSEGRDGEGGGFMAFLRRLFGGGGKKKKKR